MKKSLHLVSLVAFLMLFAASTVQAQTWTVNGKYKISVPDQDLFMTINGATGDLEWAAESDGDDPTQVWSIVDHRTPASKGLMEITANIPDVGTFTMVADTGTVLEHPIYTITVRAGEPLEVEEGDYSGLDQFQRRKTSGDVDGNDALFVKTPWGGNSRFGVVPTAAGEPVQFDGAGIDKLIFTFVDSIYTEPEVADTKLSDLQVDGATVTGFAADVLSYDVVLAAGTTDVPVVTATTSATTSTATVTAATELPGTTTVLVADANGLSGETTYSINFTVATSSSAFGLDNVYVSENILYVNSTDELLNGKALVYNLTGKLVASQAIESNNEELTMSSTGLFIVKIVNSNNELVKTLKVINK